MKYLLIFTSFLLLSCDSGETNNISQHAFLGCWENETGLEREVWTLDPSGWLVGYGASRTEAGDVTFFEHMRVERGGEAEALVVTGQDNTTVRFTRVKVDDPMIFQFENLAHDFPQIISYHRQGQRLDAWISKSDLTNKIEFKKSGCKRL